MRPTDRFGNTAVDTGCAGGPHWVALVQRTVNLTPNRATIMLIRTIPTITGSDTIEIRYPFLYYDAPAYIEYRWQVPRSDWDAAIEYMDDQPCLDHLSVVNRDTRTLNRLALFDGHDYGSEERRAALREFYGLLAPPHVVRKLGLGGILEGG